MTLQFRRRIRGPELGPVQTHINLYWRWLRLPKASISTTWKRVAAGTSGHGSVRLRKWWTWRW